MKYGTYPVVSNKNIICKDGNLVTLASGITNLPMGKHNYLVSFPVPMKTSLSKCYLEIINVYQVNSLREITKTWATEEFEVIK